MTNPLLTGSRLPLFSQISSTHFQDAIKQTINVVQHDLDEIIKNPKTSWDDTIAPLELLQNKLHEVWGPIHHLNSVMNSPEIQTEHDKCLPLVTDFYTELGQNAELFKKLNDFATTPEFSQLSPAQKRVVDNHLRDFKLSGIGLPASEQSRFKEIKSRLSELSSTFANNVLNSTKAWTKSISDETALAGLPDSAKSLLAEFAKQQEKPGWLVTLDFPCYLPIMTYADNRELRKEVYTAFCTKASDQGPNAGEFDNSPLIEEILNLKSEQAHLLGYDSYAALSVDTKMAKNTDTVFAFLNDLAEKSHASAKSEYAELESFAYELDKITDFSAWDSTYYSEKLKEEHFSIKEEDLKPYFPINNVLSGLFNVANRLFNVTIEKSSETVDLWHKDVMFFDIKDPDGSLRGQFYLDPYARQNKRGGAWMDDAVVRIETSKKNMQIPVAYLVCNFTPPVGDTPSLLTHRDVETLFHEFGHGIHHMLTKESCYSISGINGVEWDAVELPSQFMENWCWQYDALKEFAKHWETGEVIPKSLVNKLQASKKFQAGMQMVRQIEFARFDFEIHAQSKGLSAVDVLTTLNNVRSEIGVVPTPEFNRFSHSFNHIFAGGYSAGYYSYKWAEVLSADAFEEFEKNGIFDKNTGAKFAQEILQKGGSRPALDSFVAFKGREPSVDALLNQYGLVA